MTDFVLLDGGHDTEIGKYAGFDFQDHPLWLSKFLVENKDAVRQSCQDYIQAGVDMVLTNTYQATVEGFEKSMGFSREKSIETIKLAVQICKEAVEIENKKGNQRHIAVMGTVGPYGAFLHDGSEYSGSLYVDNMTIQELVDWHRPRVSALLDAGADYLFVGTIPSTKEAEAIIVLLKENPGVKAILSFSAQNEKTIVHGEMLRDAAQRCWELASDQILAIGVNCQHPSLGEPLLRSVREANPDIPLCVKCNTTETFNTTTRQWEVADCSKTLPEYCRDWLNLGVEYISGCCRTSSQDIKNFRKEIDTFKSLRKNIKV